jgi:hypothetical protein
VLTGVIAMKIRIGVETVIASGVGSKTVIASASEAIHGAAK